MGQIQLEPKLEAPRVENGTEALSDAALTRNYFRRVHETQAKNAGLLNKLVVWITGGVKTPQ
jgi:hypothetical protein